MKIRNGFVSNSSSASFILDKRYMTVDQKNKIVELNEKNKIEETGDSWSIYEDEDFLRGYTSMDNGDFFEQLKEINPPLDNKVIVRWETD
jgi:hypothetical protein